MTSEPSRRHALAAAQVTPSAELCVQCGCCTYNCPMEIDVRAFARRGKPILESFCLVCGECVHRCPRGVLRLETVVLGDRAR